MNDSFDNIAVVIVAAGTGNRFGADIPKQFCEMSGKPVLMHSIDKFRKVLPGASIRVVLSKQMIDFWKELSDRYGFISPEIVIGGASRVESVSNALVSLVKTGCEKVLIHDGVRPLVSERLILDVLKNIKDGFGTAPMIKITDSLRQIDGYGNSKTVDRECFRAVQTPQGFLYSQIAAAYKSAPDNATDDLSVIESAGGKVTAVEGDTKNIKITYPQDLRIAELLSE